MSGTDVRDLAKDNLPAGRFPVEAQADFRLYIAPEVRRGIEQHAKADVSVEICGVLVGSWGQDENGPYAAVTDYIRCENAASKFAEVTFTHESWAQINKEMDSRFADLRIVGWYHSHPDFGIFLSERDTFIQEHFFSGAGQVAYVIDPVRDLEGAFYWRNGKPTPMPHFWIGSAVRTVEASERSPGDGMNAARATQGAAEQVASPVSWWDSSTLGLLTTVLAALVLFTMGYMYGGAKTRWEQDRIIQGTVIDFADRKLIREGLEGELAHARNLIAAIANEIKKLPRPGDTLSKEQLAEAAKRRDDIAKHLAFCETFLARIEDTYGLSEQERMALARLAAQRMAELRRIMEESNEPSSTAEENKKPASAESETRGSKTQKDTSRSVTWNEGAKNGEKPEEAATLLDEPKSSK